jgi:hypothetical protein
MGWTHKRINWMTKGWAVKVLEKWLAQRHQTCARIETSWQYDSTYSELHMHILLWSYLGVGISKLVVLKSASTVNSNKFWLRYQCPVIRKLNTMDTRNVVVKWDMKFFVQLLLLKNSVTLPATVGELHTAFHLNVNRSLALHDYFNWL